MPCDHVGVPKLIKGTNVYSVGTPTKELHEKASTAGYHTSTTATTKTSAQKKSKGNTAVVIYSYVVHIEPKERRVGGPPLNWKGTRPSSECEVSF